MDDESDWRKQLLVGLGVLVIVALLVGGVVGVIAIKAADVAGIGGTPPSDTGGITFPSFTPTKSPETSSSSTPSAPTGSTPPTTSAGPPKKSGIKLTASPTEAGTYQRVNLTGTYTGATPGTSLQVQRRQGTTWTSFFERHRLGQRGAVLDLDRDGPARREPVPDVRRRRRQGVQRRHGHDQLTRPRKRSEAQAAGATRASDPCEGATAG